MGFLNLFGCPRELREALEQNRARLYRLAYAWSHNRALADDVVQETLAKALAKAGQLRDPRARDAWLFSILANCYRDHFRRHREMEDVDGIELAHEATPESESGRHEMIGQVRSAIARLPEGQRQVITLVDLEGFSYAETAQILEVPVGTVMSRLCRARQALRALLCGVLQPQETPGGHLRRVK
jgi:RNA polymerase sigma-70 factor (ECF subfamily)